MKVAVWYNNRDIRVQEKPIPSAGPGEMIVKVMSCGICGSDIMEWYRLPRAPLVPGHEMGGQVVETGPGVDRFQPGDRVFIAPKVPCMACDYCRNGHHPVCTQVTDRLPGGLAQFIQVPQALVKNGTYRLPDSISYDQSTFIEPLSCAVRAWRLAGFPTNQQVLILGSGMSGLLHVQLAKQYGCKVLVSDINPKRLDMARNLGADQICNARTTSAAQILEKTGKKADLVIVCTSASTAVEQAWQCVDKGGAIVFFAVPGPDVPVTIPINELWMKEIRVLTSYYCGPDDITEAIRFIANNQVAVTSLITHKLPLDAVTTAFQLVTDATNSIKVLLHPNG